MKQFVLEVKRLSLSREGRGVLGLLDEDGQGVEVRREAVAALLAEQGQPAVAADEGRCLLLPTRNLETWLYWLSGQQRGARVSVDEQTDYKKAGPPAAGPYLNTKQCKLAGAHLHTLNHAALPADCPSMLAQALVDLRRFLEAIRR